VQAVLFTPQVTVLGVPDLTRDADTTPSRDPCILPSWWLHVAPQYCALPSYTPLLSDTHNKDNRPTLLRKKVNLLNRAYYNIVIVI